MLITKSSGYLFFALLRLKKGDKKVQVLNQTFYHINRKSKFSKYWYEGNEIVFDKKQLNAFFSHYDDFYPTISMRNENFPILEALEIIKRDRPNLSKAHIEYLTDKLLFVVRDLALYYRETIFEEIRAENFAKLPSRKNCIWLCEEPSLYSWLEVLKEESSRIFELECTGEIHKADQFHLKTEVLPRKLIVEKAIKYWSGTNGENLTEQEILFEGKVKVLREIKKP